MEPTPDPCTLTGQVASRKVGSFGLSTRGYCSLTLKLWTRGPPAPTPGKFPEMAKPGPSGFKRDSCGPTVTPSTRQISVAHGSTSSTRSGSLTATFDAASVPEWRNGDGSRVGGNPNPNRWTPVVDPVPMPRLPFSLQTPRSRCTHWEETEMHWASPPMAHGCCTGSARRIRLVKSPTYQGPSRVHMDTTDFRYRIRNTLVNLFAHGSIDWAVGVPPLLMPFLRRIRLERSTED